MTNLQDFVMVHVGDDEPTRIGDFCSITHHATVHGATVEDDCLIGIAAVVMNGAVVGRGSIVAPGAVVTEGTVIPPHSIAAGVPARVIKGRDCSVENRMNAWSYHRNAEAYRRGEHRAWEGDEYRRWLAETLRAVSEGQDRETSRR
jgi:carbonic anhydrase/acetyltransferase-like protein (isoleucine patch superfamily)